MSFDNLPIDVRSQIVSALAKIGDEKRLEISGSATVQVEMTVLLSFDVEFEDVVVASGSRFECQISNAKVERPSGSGIFSEPETVLTFEGVAREPVDDYDIQTVLEEHLDREIRSKAEDCLEASYGVSIEYSEVRDIDFQDVFIENQTELDRWNNNEVCV